MYRFANYPETRVYSKAFIVVHEGETWCTPIVEGLKDGGEGETLEFGKAAFQTFDWTNREIVFRTPLPWQLNVEVPSRPTIILEVCSDSVGAYFGAGVHIAPGLIQPPP